MPNVKMTDLIELLDKKISELKEGDPSWTKEEKKKAKDAVEMMKAFKVLSAQACSDVVQTIPGGGGGTPMAATKKKSSRKR